MTLVDIYSDISLFNVSITGKAVIEPPETLQFSFEHRSNNAE